MTGSSDILLKFLDCADTTLSPAQRVRAASTRDRILLTPSGPSRDVPTPRVLRVRFRRAGLALASVTALTAGAVVFDSLRTDRPAYASWSATPSAVAPADVDVAAAACRRDLEGGDLDLDRARLWLAERRGDYVAVLYRTENPDLSGMCIAHVPISTGKVEEVDAGTGGSSGPALRPPSDGFTQGAVAQTHGASITDGAVGANVTAVVIRAGSRTIHATVHDGRYIAWWPGAAFTDRNRETGAPPRLLLSYDITRADGTIVRDAMPARPS